MADEFKVRFEGTIADYTRDESLSAAMNPIMKPVRGIVRRVLEDARSVKIKRISAPTYDDPRLAYYSDK